MALNLPSKQFVDVTVNYTWSGDHIFTGNVTIPADQVKATYESNPDTNAFKDADVAQIKKNKIFAMAGMVL